MNADIHTILGATWTELEGSWNTATLLLPLGSCEQHGPHLPLGTDALIAAHLVAAASAQCPNAWSLPTIPVGASGEHAGFPGTLSIGTEALTLLLLELTRSVQPPTRDLVLVSAHGGNNEALAAAQNQLRNEGRYIRIWKPSIAVPSLAHSADLHAGMMETSLMLHLEPNLVRSVPVDDVPIPDLRGAMSDLRSKGVKAVSPSGVLGLPSHASAAAGAALFAKLVDDLLHFVLHPAEGSTNR